MLRPLDARLGVGTFLAASPKCSFRMAPMSFIAIAGSPVARRMRWPAAARAPTAATCAAATSRTSTIGTYMFG
jgi:hypothetical protein